MGRGDRAWWLPERGGKSADPGSTPSRRRSRGRGSGRVQCSEISGGFPSPRPASVTALSVENSTATRARGGISTYLTTRNVERPCFGLAKAEGRQEDVFQRFPILPQDSPGAAGRFISPRCSLVWPERSRPSPLPGSPPRSPAHPATAWKPGGNRVAMAAGVRLTLDSQANRLYVARTDCVQIIDTETGRLVRAIPGFDGGGGIALAPELNDGFATSGESGTVVRFNLTSLRPYGAPISVGKEPDAVVYEPLTRHVFVFNGGSDDASVVDAATGSVVATLPLGGAPNSAVTDDQGAVFVDLHDKNEVLALDPRKNSVAHRWPLAPGTGPMGLALDPIKHRLFVGCGDGRMIVLDAQNGEHSGRPAHRKGCRCVCVRSGHRLWRSPPAGTGRWRSRGKTPPGPANTGWWRRSKRNPVPGRWPSIRRRTASTLRRQILRPRPPRHRVKSRRARRRCLAALSSSGSRADVDLALAHP